jgi:hypothetical protein
MRVTETGIVLATTLRPPRGEMSFVEFMLFFQPSSESCTDRRCGSACESVVAYNRIEDNVRRSALPTPWSHRNACSYIMPYASSRVFNRYSGENMHSSLLADPPI